MIETVAETGSTNADLLKRLRGESGGPAGEGTWLLADRQVAGKGRQGRVWDDGSGNFMGSTIVRIGPHDPPSHTLALVAGLSVFEAVVSLLPDPSTAQLKWPNDLLLREAKAAGILLERAGDAVVVGIGVNLASAPDLPDRDTIALADLLLTPDRDTFAHSLASHFATEVERWRNYGIDPIIGRWTAAAHPHGTLLTVHEPGGEIVSGTFAGLTADGSLRLSLADGSTRAIHAGDVMLA